MRGNRRARWAAVLIGSFALLLVSSVFAVGVGSVTIPPGRVVEILLSGGPTDAADSIVVFNMRLTRVVAGMFGGGALAVSGLLLQILFQNPIADPYVLGISSGARLFVGLVMLSGVTFGFSVTNPWFLFLGALLGSLGVMSMVLLFAAKLKSVVTLLIVGTMLGYLCSALVGLLVAFSDDSSIADFTRWGMGSFGVMTWNQIAVLTCVCAILFLACLLLTKNLNALALGENYARTMGVNTRLMRVLIILISSVLTAVVTAFAGLIAFVGMSVPHICRLLLGSEDARVLVPAVILAGGTFGVLCDLIARTAAAPGELAVGTITSLVGVPIVLFLLVRRGGKAR